MNELGRKKVIRQLPSQVSRDRFELGEDVLGRFGRATIRGGVQTVVDVIVDEGFLGLSDRLLHGVELLREIEAGTAVGEHLNYLVKMAFGAFQAFDDFRMAGVRMFFHGDYLSPWRGYGNPACGWWACGKTRVGVGLQAAKLGCL